MVASHIVGMSQASESYRVNRPLAVQICNTNRLDGPHINYYGRFSFGDGQLYLFMSHHMFEYPF